MSNYYLILVNGQLKYTTAGINSAAIYASRQSGHVVVLECKQVDIGKFSKLGHNELDNDAQGVQDKSTGE